MQTIKQQIPNLITLGNLLCGCLAIKFAFEWEIVMAIELIAIGAVLDFFDGFAARLLKVSGDMGKQLDSLADMVTFGVAPGILVFQLLRMVLVLTTVKEADEITEIVDTFTYFAFLIPIFSAYRLAKFNIDTRQSDKFIGLPTPANTIFWCGIIIAFFYQSPLEGLGKEIFMQEHFNFRTELDIIQFLAKPQNIIQSFLLSPLIISILTVVFSILLIVELPLFALKFKTFGFQGNEIRYIFLSISAAMLIIFQLIAIPFIILLYLLMSVINNFTLKQ